MKVLNEELRKYTKPTHLVEFTVGQDDGGYPIFASASETVETVDGWLQAGDNVVYKIQYGLTNYVFGTTTDHTVGDMIKFAAFITTEWFGPLGVYRLEARWSITDEAPDALPTIYSIIPMETDYNPGAIARVFDEGLSYEVGDVVMYEGMRYRCTTDTETPGEFNPSNWTQENVQTAMENPVNHSYVFNTPVQTTSTTDETDDTISVELANRAMNIVQLATTVKYLNITFPQITTGYSRDFFVRLVITGDVPTISFSEYGGGLPDFDIADDVWSNMKQGVNIILFTETSQA